MRRAAVSVVLAASVVLSGCAPREEPAPSLTLPDTSEAEALAAERAAKEAAYRQHFDRGAQALAAGDPAAAITHFQQATSEKPDGEAYFQIGRAYLAKKNDAEALKAFSEAVRLDSQHADAYIERAALHDRAGRLNDASYDYRQAIAVERDPKTTARAYWLRSGVVDRLGKRKDFRFDREQAMKLDPAYRAQVTSGDVCVFNHTDKKLTISFEKFVKPDGALRTFPPGYKFTVPDDNTAFLLDDAGHMPAKFVRFTVANDLGSRTFEQSYEKGTTLDIHLYEADLPKK